MTHESGRDYNYDLIIAGAGISGTFLALHLLRTWPATKIVFLEQSTEFAQKVGESTSDMTGLMLRRMNLNHLLEKHPEKTGLRFLFNEKKANIFKDCAEFSSPSIRSVTNGYHINRKLFDEQMLGEVVRLGAKVIRPSEILDVNCSDFENQIVVKNLDSTLTLHSRWLADATGRARFLHRHLKWKDISVPLHTSSVYAHFTGVLPRSEWDVQASSYWEKNAIGSDDYSTIHFMTENCWWWFIRIDTTTTSIGCVVAHKHFDLDNPDEFFERQLNSEPLLRKLTAGAKRGSVRFIGNLAYCSEKFCTRGQILLGDSGGFVDPLVSPGIEMILQQSKWIAPMLVDDIRFGRFNSVRWQKYDRTFRRSFMDRCEIYASAYPLMGSYDLMKNWLRTAMFGYFGIRVFLAILFPSLEKKPVVLNLAERWSFRLINLRLKRIAKMRMRAERISLYGANEISFSAVYVSTGWKKLLIPGRMFYLWLSDSLHLFVKESVGRNHRSNANSK